MIKKLIPVWILGLIVLFLTHSSITHFMSLSIFSYLLLLSGFLIRKNHRLGHVTCMISAITLDLLLVLILQIQRSAIQTAIHFELTPIQMIHVGVSSIATACYFPVIYLGFLRLTGKKPHLWKRHAQIGMTAFVARSLGLILMFSMLSRYKHS